MREFEHKGRWWYPAVDDEDSKALGTLKFHPIKGATLEVLGRDFSTFPHDIEVPGKILLGYSEGLPITLYEVVSDGFAIRDDGYSNTTYRVGVIFVGVHFEKEEDIIFDSMSIHFSHLTEWVGKSGFSVSFKKHPNRWATHVEGEFKYTPIETQYIQIQDFKLGFDYELEVIGDLFKEIRAKQTTYVDIIPDIPKTFHHYHDYFIYNLRNFLTLSIGRRVLPFIVTGMNKEHTHKNRVGIEVPRDISIYYSRTGAELEQGAPPSQRDIVIKYSAIEKDFAKYLQNWFDKVESLHDVMNLYFGLFYIPKIYEHLEFLSLIQALEIYHRQVTKSERIPRAEYEEFLPSIEQAIRSIVDEKYADLVVEHMKYGFQYNLRKRLNLILNERLHPYQDTLNNLNNLIGGKKKREDFISEVVATRNYLTHYGDQGEAVMDFSERVNLSRQLRYLIQLCFFVELEIPPEVITKEAVQRWHRYI